MSTLNAGTVRQLISMLAADRHPDAPRTAVGRHAVVTALAVAVGAVADGIPALDCAICPREQERSRTRADRRWYTVLADMDRAARDSEYLEAGMTAAATQQARMITRGEPVLYHGSLSTQHGAYLLAGNCPCQDDQIGADWRECEGLALSRRGVGIVLTCVNPHSISPADFDDPSRLHAAHRIAPALIGAIEALRQPVDPDHAATLVRGLAGITGRLADVLAGWYEPIRRQIQQCWRLDLDGPGDWRNRQSVIRRLETASAATTAVRGTLRHAAGALAEISDHPHTKAAA